MNEVAQSALPLTSSDLSIFILFWNAHWIVQGVMLVTAVVFLLSSLVADVLFAALDPRIRYAD